MMKKALLIIGLLGLLALAYGLYEYQRPVGSLTNEVANFSLPASTFFQEFEADENAANAKYLDKIIRVTGQVKGTDFEGDSPNIVLETGDEMFGVVCQLDPTKALPTQLAVGTTVNIKGNCTGKLMDVVLVNCIIE